LIFLFSCIGVIISTKKIKLEFDNQNKILTILDSHILGGGTKYFIPYQNLQFHINPKNTLNKILNKPELTILNNSSKIVEINNLQYIYKSNQLIAILENIIKKK